jgi:tRNA U54 and U55 pseudouridine synthase Pus10
MTNFESKGLKRKFDKIVFGDLAGAGAIVPKDKPDIGKVHAGLTAARAAADVKVPKASGPNARTVAEIVTGRAALKDKTILVRGKVVKYNPGILGTNWIHLRDGSGSAAEQTNDVLVTSKSETTLGEVVLVKGVVRTDKDFGAGYSYRVMIEATELAAK